MQLVKLEARHANALIVADPTDTHYLGTADYLPTWCIATQDHDAVALFAPPTPWHFKRVLNKPLELTRLWQSQARRERREPLSQFLAAALRYVRKLDAESDCVFSYADPARVSPTTGTPHKGTIYKACNFLLLGPSRVTDEWETKTGERLSSPVCYRRYHTKSRAHLSGVAPYQCTHKRCKTHEHIGPGLTLIEKPQKILYVYGLRRTSADIRGLIGGRYA